MGSLVSTPACHSSFPPIPHTGKAGELEIEDYHWPSGPVTEYKRLSDVLKISENVTRLPEPEERCRTGREPSYLPPSPPAQDPWSLSFMRGPKMGYPVQDQIQISEHRWHP